MILNIFIIDTTLFCIELDNLYLDKKYISNEIIKKLINNGRLPKKLKRLHIMKLAKFTSITIKNEDKYRILKGNEVVDFCINWPKFYIENHGNIFNRL